MSSLRLFPLHSVLLPGGTMPLHVFEPRYRQLVAECQQEGEPFGIVLIREGAEVGGPALPVAVGCTALIEEAAPAGDERLTLRVRGGRRFRIVDLRHDHPYLAAHVEYPVDEQTAVAGRVVDEARERYARLLRLRLAARGEYVRQPAAVPRTAGPLADAIAWHATTDATRLQPVLAEMDVRRRLHRATGLLDAALQDAHRATSQAVAEQWGNLGSRN